MADYKLTYYIDMNKLIELEKIAKEANEAFIYAKPHQSLKELHKAQEQAYKDLREYKNWLYKGSCVNGNEI